MKEAVKGRAPVSMDALVQQIESPFTAGVLHFPLPEKFRMPQIETFDGAKDPKNHLNTYKNHMELHGYQEPVRCRAFTIALMGPALAWFNPPAVITHMLNVNPSCPSKEALLLKRKIAGETKKVNKAPRDKQTGTDSQGRAEKIESGPDKMREHHESQGTTLA